VCPSLSCHGIGVQLFLTRTFFGRLWLAVAQDQLALRLMGRESVRVKELASPLDRAAGVAGAFLIVIQPVHRRSGANSSPRLRGVRAGACSSSRTLLGAFVLGAREILHSRFRAFVGPGGFQRSARHAAFRPRALGR